MTAPAFAEYQTALESVGCRVERYFLRDERDFALDEGILEAIRPGVEMVFLCEPNNPTGRTTAPGPCWSGFWTAAGKRGRCWWWTSASGTFWRTPPPTPLRGSLAAYPSLLILKAFTKIYGMAGVRLGYALCADEDLLDGCAGPASPGRCPPRPQEAGLAALRETAYVEQVRALIARERPRLAAGLRALGCRVVEGEANYLMFRCEKPLIAPLRRRGILLRSCGNYAGLDDGWYRTAVRTGPENDRLLAALEEVLG